MIRVRPGDLLACPASALYGAVVATRNWLFDRGVLPSRCFDSPVVVCVGNITVGGTGKTPHVEALVAGLKGEFRVACLSRGYGRTTSGFRLVGEGCSPAEVGDEPRQVKNKFPDVVVAVDGNRTRGIERLRALASPPEVVIMDDGFQHRYVTPRVSIVLVDYARPLHADHLLPRGRLREPAGPALRRADVVIVTKCPFAMSDREREAVVRQLRLEERQQLLFTTMNHGWPVPLHGGGECDMSRDSSVLCVTGIARPTPLLDYLERAVGPVFHMRFPDHHRFSRGDTRRIVELFQGMQKDDRFLITTEKDATRLDSSSLPAWVKERVFYVPLETRFLGPGGDSLFKLIAGHARQNRAE
ncbi:MAG: tetraacyldisaccharide 4'-kinase [Odoribacteraceae bacterium]|nr:tetraacyldisaccharide 4'-kinase [Odoribacteraceae bacterium]